MNWILISGIPGTGKSHFSQELTKLNFMHLEQDAINDWDPDLKNSFDTNKNLFTDNLKKHESNVFLEWGFVPNRINEVKELIGLGFKALWFTGNENHAFVHWLRKHPGVDSRLFRAQVERIKTANLPNRLFKVVNTLKEDGNHLDFNEIAEKSGLSF